MNAEITLLEALLRAARAKARRELAVEEAARGWVEVGRAVSQYQRRLRENDWPVFEIPASVRRVS